MHDDLRYENQKVYAVVNFGTKIKKALAAGSFFCVAHMMKMKITIASFPLVRLTRNRI